MKEFAGFVIRALGLLSFAIMVALAILAARGA